MRFAAKRDASEGPIVQALELSGWKVFKLSAPGWPDMMAARHGAVVFLEAKTKAWNKLNPLQVEMHLRLKSAGLRVCVVRTPTDALAAVGGRE